MHTCRRCGVVARRAYFACAACAHTAAHCYNVIVLLYGAITFWLRILHAAVSFCVYLARRLCAFLRVPANSTTMTGTFACCGATYATLLAYACALMLPTIVHFRDILAAKRGNACSLPPLLPNMGRWFLFYWLFLFYVLLPHCFYMMHGQVGVKTTTARGQARRATVYLNYNRHAFFLACPHPIAILSQLACPGITAPSHSPLYSSLWDSLLAFSRVPSCVRLYAGKHLSTPPPPTTPPREHTTTPPW